VSELIQGEFMMVADPVRLKLASCERVNKIVGSSEILYLPHILSAGELCYG
jgi:hypothetical protein